MKKKLKYYFYFVKTDKIYERKKERKNEFL